MHSKSENLGYLKDQKREIFWGAFPPGPTGGSEHPPKPPALRCLHHSLLRIYFFPDSRFACSGMSECLYLETYLWLLVICAEKTLHWELDIWDYVKTYTSHNFIYFQHSLVFYYYYHSVIFIILYLIISIIIITKTNIIIFIIIYHYDLLVWLVCQSLVIFGHCFIVIIIFMIIATIIFVLIYIVIISFIIIMLNIIMFYPIYHKLFSLLSVLLFIGLNCK